MKQKSEIWVAMKEIISAQWASQWTLASQKLEKSFTTFQRQVKEISFF